MDAMGTDSAREDKSQREKQNRVMEWTHLKRLQRGWGEMGEAVVIQT